MSVSQFFVEDAVMTRPGSSAEATAGVELVFTVFRTYFWEERPVSVDYVISNGTAVADTDFDGTSDPLTGTLTFNKNEIWKPIRIHLLNAGSGDLTLTCTITPASSHRSGDYTFNGDTWTHVGTGTIQDGEIFYISASGDSGNDGLSPSTPKDINSAHGLIVAPASGGQGRAILLKAGDTMTTTQIWPDANRKGGTANNPCIMGRYGAGANPIVIKNGFYLGFNADTGQIDGCTNIWQDIEFRGSANADANVIQVFKQNAGIYPKNCTIQRCKITHPEGYATFGGLINNPSMFDGKITFCDISRGAEFGVIGGGDDGGFQLYGCTLYNNDTFAVPSNSRDWAAYLGETPELHVWNNHFYSNTQALKIRPPHVAPTGSDRSRVAQNLFDCRETEGNIAVTINADGIPDSANYTDENHEFYPQVKLDVEQNMIIGSENCNIMYISDADGYDFQYDPAAAAYVDINVRNNICVQISETGGNQSLHGIINVVQNHESIRFYNNTILRLSDALCVRYSAYPGNFVQASKGNDDPSYYSRAFAQGFVFRGNLIASKVAAPSLATILFEYGTSSNVPYDVGADPDVYVDKDYNHYCMEAGDVWSYNSVGYSLSEFVAAFTLGGEQNSIEAGANMIVSSSLEYAWFPASPEAADPNLVPEYDFFNLPRGSDTCAGAIHRLVASPSSVSIA